MTGRRNAMSITYKDAGVDKEAGYRQVQLIKDMIRRTHTDGVISDNRWIFWAVFN